MPGRRWLIAGTSALAAGGLFAGILIASPSASAAMFPWWHHHHHGRDNGGSPSPSPSQPSASPSGSPSPLASPFPTPAATASTSPAGSASGTAPVPAALAGHPLVTTWTPPQISSSPWNDPGNAPGNCPANPSAVSLNSSGFAELDTTGQAGNCTSVQSPQTVPTSPGYVYEADICFSNFQDWPAFWMYGQNWPGQGEIDAVEANFGVNYVSWHYGSVSDQLEISTNPFTYAGKTTATPVGTNITAGSCATAGNWHIVDIAFTSSGVSVYYDGSLYISISETITTAGNDPMWLTVSEGSCEAAGNNVCASGALGTPGTVQVKYIRQFS